VPAAPPIAPPPPTQKKSWADSDDEEPPHLPECVPCSTSLPGAEEALDGEHERLVCLASWTTALTTRDETWRRLHTEKRTGWASAALDWWWRENDKIYQNQDRKEEKGGIPSTTKYVRFYTNWLPRVSKELFRPGGPPRNFADLGASPGGLCEYLVGSLGWTGCAMSLPAGLGFGMAFTHKDLGYADCDLEAEGEWRKLLEVVPAGSCDFVNGGVVVDRGQRVDPDAAAEEHGKDCKCTDCRQAAIARAADPAAAAAAAAALSDIRVAKFVKIIRNELLFGLHALREGGALYFAFQLGQYSLLFRLLQLLRPCFEGTLRATPTMAPHRTPIYVYLGCYKGASSEAATAAIAFLESTPASDEAFLSWHLSSFDDATAKIHEELQADLQHVWSQQLHHLVKQREQAERSHAQAHAAPSERFADSSRFSRSGPDLERDSRASDDRLANARVAAADDPSGRFSRPADPRSTSGDARRSAGDDWEQIGSRQRRDGRAGSGGGGGGGGRFAEGTGSWPRGRGGPAAGGDGGSWSRGGGSGRSSGRSLSELADAKGGGGGGWTSRSGGASGRDGKGGGEQRQREGGQWSTPRDGRKW